MGSELLNPVIFAVVHWHHKGGAMLAPQWLVRLTHVELAAMACFFVLMLWRRMWAKWPFLFAAVAVELAVELAGIAMLGRKGFVILYFWSFWIAIAVQALLRFFVIADILRSFSGLDFLPRKLYLFVGVAGATMAIASATTCFHHGSAATQTREWAALLNHCVSMAWMAFGVAMLGAIKWRNFGWHPLGGRIAIGVFTRLAVSGLAAQVFTDLSHHNRNMRLTMNGLDSVCTIAVFLFWSYVLVRPPRLGRNSDAIATNPQPTNRAAIPPNAEKEELFLWTRS